MIPMELLTQPVLQWLEPPEFRRQRQGEEIRIGGLSHLFFLAVTLGYLAYRVLVVGAELQDIATLLSAIGLGIAWAYLPLLIAKHQALPIRVMGDQVVCLRAFQAGILPSFALIRVRFEAVANYTIQQVSSDGDKIDALVLLAPSNQEVLRVGLSPTVPTADLVEHLHRKDVLPLEENSISTSSMA